MPEFQSIASIELQVPCGGRSALGAALTLPPNPQAAALILQGAGPHDRDGAMPAFGFHSTLYRRLTYELGSRFALACLRYDKRGHNLPADAPQDYSLAGRLQDAEAALEVMEIRPEISGLKHVIIGHSEGGRLALKVGARASGVASLAAPFGNVFELNRERARRAAQSSSASQRRRGHKSLEFLEALEQQFKTGRAMTPAEFRAFALPWLDQGFAGWESYEWLHEHWLNVLETRAVRLSGPLLVVQGGRDARLSADTPDLWKSWCQGRAGTAYEFIAGMGHDLNDARRKAFVLDEALLAALGRWISAVAHGGR